MELLGYMNYNTKDEKDVVGTGIFERTRNYILNMASRT